VWLLTESALPLATRRVRRQRRLQQRIGGGPLLSDARYRQIASSLAIILAVAVVVSTLLNRAPEPEIIIPAEDFENLVALEYSADALRPNLGPADEAGIPTPASYSVAQGETLLAVAFRFGSTVEAIRLANNMDDADRLSVGQSLVVPPPRSVLHPVDPSLPSADIAEAFEVAPEIFAAYNGMAADAINEPIGRGVAILPAAVLGLPAEQLAEPARVEIVTTAAAADAESAADATVTYTVAEGDTILAIAHKLGVDADELVAANQLSDSNLIVVGDALAVPLWSRPARDAVAGANPESTTAATSAAATVERAIERPSAPFVYELAPGDTLHDVAWKFGVDVYTLMNNNELANADLVRAGTQLTVLPVSGLMYTVAPGDTLERIARTFQVDLGPIIDFNYLEDVDFIAVGRELILPGAAPLPPPAPAPTLPTTYTVASGDTVGGIARLFGITADDIVAANGMRSADRISVGQTLRITAGAAAVARPGPAPARAAPAAQTVTRNLPVPAQAPVQQTAPTAPSSASGSIVSTAMQYRGSRYVFGGTTPAGFDCSGFVYYVMNRAGKPISRGMWGQYGAGSHPGRGALQPGDIVFFQNTYMPGLSHNGIYIGNGQFIHASDPGSGVKVSSLSESYWASRWFGATRV